jgi:hypothetical protein
MLYLCVLVTLRADTDLTVSMGGSEIQRRIKPNSQVFQIAGQRNQTPFVLPVNSFWLEPSGQTGDIRP